MKKPRRITHKCSPSWGVTECQRTRYTVKTSSRWVDVTCKQCLKAKR